MTYCSSGDYTAHHSPSKWVIILHSIYRNTVRCPTEARAPPFPDAPEHLTYDVAGHILPFVTQTTISYQISCIPHDSKSGNEHHVMHHPPCPSAASLSTSKKKKKEEKRPIN